MDHLPIPPGATHIHVPYKCTELYDGGDFFGYPERKGWSTEKLLGYNKFGHEKEAKVEAFFQTWLYFGTLICVFKLNGVDVDTSEFVTTDSQSGAQFVTTSALPAKIQAWKAEWVRSGKKRDSPVVQETHKILKELKKYLDRYCGREDRESADGMLAPTTMLLVWPVADEIALSMMALGHMVGAALPEISGDGRVRMFTGTWGEGPMLKAMAVENGWCPMDVRRFARDVGVDGQYYLALKTYLHEEYRHGGCTESACRALTVNESTYVVQHVDPNCPCIEEMATEAVVAIVKRGGVPVVAWRKNVENGGPAFIVEDAVAQNLTYVAVSHVWADGLGNPRENALPVCQLERIQARVNAVFPDSENPVRFWMDTLCIPCAEEYDELRKKSIKMMREIYRHAGAVLVFDKGLQRLSISDTLEEKSLGLYLSNWMHRLWTFQEGMLAKELYFQLNDGVLRQAAFSEDGAEEANSAAERGFYDTFQFSARCSVTAHFSIVKDVIQDMDFDNKTLLAILSHALQQRTTTRMSDEAICIATILELDTEDIVEAKTKGMPDDIAAERRMQILFKQLGMFNPEIIFHAQHRMRSEGYRWAPKTTMGARPGDFFKDVEGQRVSNFTGEGLPVAFPGFILESVTVGSATEIVVLMTQDWCLYRVKLFPEEGEEVEDAAVSHLPRWDPDAVYAVVMLRPVGKYTLGTDAVVGILKDPAEIKEEQAKERKGRRLGQTIRMSCECRAWMEPCELPSPMVQIEPFVADSLGNRQKWCIF